MAFTVGVANVLVAPAFTGFQAAVGRQVNRTMPPAGRAAGAAMGAGMATGVAGKSGAISTAAGQTAGAAASTVGTAGRTAGAAMGSGIASGLGGASRAVSTAAGTAMAGVSPVASAAGATAGTGFIGRAAGAVGRGASAVTGSVRTAMAGAAAAGTAAGTATGAGFLGGMGRALGPLAAIFGVGAVISSGVSRFTAIEDAQAKLTGLGHSAETVDEVMRNVEASVEGTALRTDEAATVAAGLLAAGIAPGDDLTRVLGGVGDAATIAGTSVSEMGAIYNKIAASGRIQGEELNQLSDAGIPILQLLSDELGVSVDKVRDLASQGKVDFATFEAAMSAGMEGAAKKSGDTLSGLFNNVGAYVARLGAAIVTEVSPALRTMGETAIEVIDQRLIPAFQTAASWVRQNMGLVKVLAGVVGGLVAAFVTYKVTMLAIAAVTRAYAAVVAVVRGVMFAWTVATRGLTAAQLALNGAQMANPIGLLVVAIAALVAGLVIAYRKSETFRNVVLAVWGAIKTAISAVWNGVLKPVFTAIGGFLTNVVAPAMQWFYRSVVLPVWNAIGTAIRWVWNNIVRPALDAFRAFLRNVIAPIVRWLYENIVKPYFQAIGLTIRLWWNVAKAVFNVFRAFLRNVVGPVIQWLYRNVARPVFAAIGGVIRVWWNVAKLVFDAFRFFLRRVLGPVIQWLYRNVVKPIFAAITNWIRARIAAGRAILDAFRSFLRNVIAPVIQWLYRNIIQPIFGAIADRISSVWRNRIKPVLTAFRDFVRGPLVDGIKNGVERLSNAWKTVANLFRRPINWVINTVWNDGLKKAFDNVAKAINSDARLPRAATIPKFARGGRHDDGWAMVGEEGPELVNFDRPGRIYTANQTAAALAAGRDLSPQQARRAAGSSPDEALAPMGGGIISSAIDWIRGGLASAASAVLDPVKELIKNTVGQWGPVGRLGGGAANFAISKVVEWIRGKDDEYNAAGGGGGIDAFLWALRQHESGGRYRARNPRSSASGAYQYINSTWGNYGGYRRAYLAPPAVQDRRARRDQMRNYRRYGNWEQTAAAHFYPAWANRRDMWGRRPSPGNPTVNAYVSSIMRKMRNAPARYQNAGGATHGGPAPGRGGWMRPSRGPITSRFGPRWGRLHAGVDIAGGGPTFAPAAGTIFRTGSGILGGRTGLGIGISHGGGIFSYLGHNPVGGIRVRPGQRVSKGQRVGAQGATGNVTGIHVHYEHHRGGWGRAVNPIGRVMDKGGLLEPGMLAYHSASMRTPDRVLTDSQWRDMHTIAQRGGGSQRPIEQHFHGARDDLALARMAAARVGDEARKEAARGAVL